MRLTVCLKLTIGTLTILWAIYFIFKFKGLIIECRSDFNHRVLLNNMTNMLQTSTSHVSSDSGILSDADYNRLIDVNFTFTIRNFICDKTVPLLLILIHSAPTNFFKRKVIRETWGRNEKDIKLLFLLGTSGDTQTDDMLRKENFLHNDILQGNFIDTYRNLTYKHVMGLKFVVYHCSQAKYLLKVDDDTCVNTPLLKNFLSNDLGPHRAKNLLMCNVIGPSVAIRTYRSKWRVSFDQYKPKFYPKYCFGWYILYSSDTAYHFYKEVQNISYFWIDDVLVTGVVAARINFTSHIDLTFFTLTIGELEILQYSNHKLCKAFLFGHADMTENEIRFMWKYIENNPVRNSLIKSDD